MRYIMNRKETEINENKRKQTKKCLNMKNNKEIVLFFFFFCFFFFFSSFSSCGELMSSCRYKIIIRCYKSDYNFWY
jgi:hypothetical protein